MLLMQVMLRMEETRRIRMKQRADKWKEQVMMELMKVGSLWQAPDLFTFILCYPSWNSAVYCQEANDKTKSCYWYGQKTADQKASLARGIVLTLLRQVERADRWRREPQKVFFSST